MLPETADGHVVTAVSESGEAVLTMPMYQVDLGDGTMLAAGDRRLALVGQKVCISVRNLDDVANDYVLTLEADELDPYAMEQMMEKMLLAAAAAIGAPPDKIEDIRAAGFRASAAGQRAAGDQGERPHGTDHECG